MEAGGHETVDFVDDLGYHLQDGSRYEVERLYFLRVTRH